MRNLEAEMRRSGIRSEDIKNLLNCSDRTARNKIKGVTPFTFPEAEIVRNHFFPGLLMEYLFAADNNNQAS